MNGILKQNKKKIILILVLFLVIVNLFFLITSNEKNDSKHKFASRIVSIESVDKISFCANKDFFEDSLSGTLESIDEAVEEKTNAMILDIYLSKDNLLVCSPFENLKENLYLDGTISDYTYFELTEYAIAVGKKEISFSINPAIEVIKQCIENDIIAVCVFHNITDLETLNEILSTYQSNKSFIVYSSNYDFLINVNKAYPSLKLWYFVDEITEKEVEKMNLLPEAEIIFNANNKNNNEEIIKKLNDYSYIYGCSGVNKKSTLKKVIDLGVSDIISAKYVK